MLKLDHPVLVVEDVDSVRKLLCTILEKNGVTTVECGNGLQALALWQKHKFSVVFMDFELPGLHGLDIISQIKNASPDTYVVALTGSYDPENFKRAIALGVDSWIAKPFSAEIIKTVIRKAVLTCAARRSERLMRSAFEYSASAQIILNASGLIEDVNQCFLDMVEVDRNDVIGRDPNIFIKKASSPIPSYSDTKEATIVSASGNIIHALVSTGPTDEDSKCKPVSIVDISMLKQRENEIHKMATTDPLTGLPNRTVMEDRIHQAATKADRNGTRLAVMFLDLDKFKNINDTYGHEAGDQLLIEFGTRIRKTLRTSDTLSRFGGDEFLVLLPEVSNANGAMYTASKIIEALKKPFLINGVEIVVSSSIGVAVYPDIVEDSHELIRMADEAMYKSKHSGRGCATLIHLNQLT